MSGDYAAFCKRMQDECMEFKSSAITEFENRRIEFRGKMTPKLDGYLNGIPLSQSFRGRDRSRREKWQAGNGHFVHQIRGTKANLVFWPNFQPPMTFARWRRADMQV